MFERAMPQIYRRHRRLLTRNECAVLMLPAKAYLAVSPEARRRMRLEAYLRVLWMFVLKPAATLRAIRSTQFSIKKLKVTLVPMFFARLGLVPQDVQSKRDSPGIKTALSSGTLAKRTSETVSSLD